MTADSFWVTGRELMVDWMRSYPALCSSLNDFFEPLVISNYCTPVPRNEPLSIPQMSMLSLNNFPNNDGATHDEIFRTQFSSPIRLWKDS